MAAERPCSPTMRRKPPSWRCRPKCAHSNRKKAQAAGEANKKEGDAFLAANKTKEGVVTLPSGLQYKILKEGTGPKPTASDSVVCNYRGTFINGKEFDSSYKRGQPATFPVTGVIKGWTEALSSCPSGRSGNSSFPSDLAYGDAGRPGIEPSSTLIFEVELLSIEDKSKDKAPEKKKRNNFAISKTGFRLRASASG
jgi:FKBP-type peptidyl-prolyl cis-trans isomerase